jgi:hypothetical protein
VSGISRHRFEGNRAAVTAWDIQVEAKLRRLRGTTLAVPALILCLSLRAVKENLGSTIRLDKHLVLRNIEVGTPMLNSSEAKKFLALRSRANGIRSWASFNLSKQIGMEANKTSKLGRVPRKPRL